MSSRSTNAAAMAFFVLLWGSAGVFIRWSLDHSSVFAVLILRFALAFAVTSAIALGRRRWLPQPGTRWRVAGTGLVLIGLYALCYIQAMAHGATPGLLATLLGVQPILTLVWTERSVSPRRLLGLLLALSGLVLVVYQSLIVSKFSALGIAFGFGALVCMTLGTLSQKRIQQPPIEVLPLQYGVTLLLLLCLAPFQPLHFEPSVSAVAPVVWLALLTSVGAQLLLYPLIRSGNLVNVTSLFYLVPVVAVVLDYLVLGNALPSLALLGMVTILGGLLVVFRQAPQPLPKERPAAG